MKLVSARRYLLAVVIGVCLGTVLYVIGFAKVGVNQNPSLQNSINPPEVLSCVKNVKVISRRVDAGKLIVEVENTSDLGVVAISLESKKGKDSYIVRTSTFEADEVLVIIKPHERHELSMELSNIMPKAHLQIGSVVYADGTEDGCEASVQATRKSKTYHEQIKAQRKGPR